MPEPQEPQNRFAGNHRTHRETGRRTALRETAFQRNFDRITEIVEIVMCFSSASALDIVNPVLSNMNLLETTASSGVESSGWAARRIGMIVCRVVSATKLRVPPRLSHLAVLFPAAQFTSSAHWLLPGVDGLTPTVGPIDRFSSRHTFRKRSHNDSTPERSFPGIAVVGIDRCADARVGGSDDLRWWLYRSPRNHQTVRPQTIDGLKRCSGRANGIRTASSSEVD